jgi:HPt (histidine-containing phosphotransfer) domain-containing protein
MKRTVNPEKIQELFELDDDGEVLKELINLFIPSTQKKLERLSELLSSADSAEIKPLAHEMRSSCANVGAEVLSDLATQLEYLPTDLSYQSNVTGIVQKMLAEFQLVKAELTKHL